ncbi:RhoGAP-domain-containing protein [Daedalea quercina L-15889]|uniref:RhoGAP-domain-containing protein n=1 Tax=Daedalea quercina L-15889 TaxID=1314783 RepID=A0A165RH44_9APHY|nr:RhoGAP-domain-containing protein [Daedalea quercina L-15889]
MAAALSHMLSANGRVEDRPAVSSSRDRERHDSSRSQHQSPGPASLRPHPSFNASQPSVPSSQPLTVDALLAAHANARDPTRSALEAAISERNTLSLQNTQLWKLIEKQRSGYGQLMKELERVRGERDVYRLRLQAAGENTDALLRAQRDKEKRDGKEAALRSSSSHSQLRGSDGSSSGPAADPRARVSRQNSEDTASRNLHHSHSQDQALRSYPSREHFDSQSSLNLPASGSRGSPAPSSSLSTVSTTRVQNIPRDVPSGWRSISSQVTSPTQQSFSQAPSSTSVSSSSTVASSELADPVLGQWQSGYRPSLDTARPMGKVVLTPAAESTYPPRPASPARLSVSPNTNSPSTQHSSPDTPSNHSLSPHTNGGRNGLSRESRISLPEEAKRYYANLADSPMPSPGIGPSDISTSSARASPTKTQLPLVAEVAESLRSRSETPSSSGARSRVTGAGDEAAPFLDMGDGDSMHSSEQGRSSTAENGLPYDDSDQASRPEKDAIPEDFPLPPTTATPSYPAGEMLRVTQSHASEPPRTPVSPFPITDVAPQMKFRALPLLASDLPHTEICVVTSTIRPNERGKEVLSFVIAVYPGKGKDSWRIEKLYSDVLALDARVRGTLSKNVLKKMVALPEGRMWRDHAPARVDQRKHALQEYLRSLIALPVKNKDEVIAFFTSDIVRDAQKPVSQPGYKEGYLTKRGKNFGGWKSRYFVLQGPSLEYYESRGGAHLGSITITGAQIGRQQKPADRRDADEDNEYRHAFLIIEAKRGPGGSSSRHVLCADSDDERDSWVEELVRYVTGSYTEDQVAMVQNGPSPIAVGGASQSASPQPRSSTSTNLSNDPFGTPSNGRRDAGRGDLPNGRVYANNAYEGTPSPVKSMLTPSPLERVSIDVAPMSNSMPTTSPLIGEDVEAPPAMSQRANSELGHYTDMKTPDQNRRKNRRMSVNPLKAPIPERTPSPDKEAAVATTPKVDVHGKVKISGPMNGTPIPAGYKFGGKDEKPEPAPSVHNDRREKAKSRTFWGFGRQQHDKPAVPTMAQRAVFGVTLDESLDVAQIASLPAIVFRCIQYLEAKQAEQEEGIYRLSGSSAVIKSLKDRFNTEGDVDLLGSDEYWDPHAIAGLLKTFLRELPASILTRDLHLRFLSVIDFVDPQERIRELSLLIAALPIANYSLLRALTAHLILIVQNAHVNKMTMRNVGIVFSPTLGIPAGVFSLMLGEFKRVFNVDGTLEESAPAEEEEVVDRRNSRRYTDAAADQLLGLSGRALPAGNDDTPSDDGEEGSSVIEESVEGTAENDTDVAGSSAGSSVANLAPPGSGPPPSDSLQVPEQSGGMAVSGSPVLRSRAAHLAATRGLNISVGDKASRRNSHVVGLPASPRPSPRSASNGAPSPSVGVSSPLTPR